MNTFKHGLPPARSIFFCVLLGSAPLFARPVITEFPLPTPASRPSEITGGSDGNVWFLETAAGKIGRITPQGDVTEFPVPGQVPLVGIASGPDGNVWYTAVDLDDGSGGKIGRISPSGSVSEISVEGSMPCEIVAGPDGNLWITECNVTANAVDRVTPAGAVTRFPLPTNGPGHYPLGIAPGPDGNLWFTEPSIQTIGRITPAGVVTEFPVPGSSPDRITAGSDGNLWFAEDADPTALGRLTTSGQVSQIDIPGPNNFAFDVTTAPDGDVWFAGGSNIGRVTTDGQFEEFDLPNGDSTGIAAGPGGIWFTDENANTVGRLDVPEPCPPDALCLGDRFEISTTWRGGGSSGIGHPAPVTPNTGAFWFFDASNVEVFVKILDTCRATGKFDVYVNGLTHLGVTVTVTDIRTGTSRSFVNPGGTPFSLLFDDSTFACP